MLVKQERFGVSVSVESSAVGRFNELCNEYSRSVFSMRRRASYTDSANFYYVSFDDLFSRGCFGNGGVFRLMEGGVLYMVPDWVPVERPWFGALREILEQLGEDRYHLLWLVDGGRGVEERGLWEPSWMVKPRYVLDVPVEGGGKK